MNKIEFLNYFGQLRIYSLIDLILLTFAAKAAFTQILGIIFLHLGFLLYLEKRHNHAYRKRIPSFIWIILTLIGLALFRNSAVIFYIFFSFLYTEKNKYHLGLFSPVFRGAQSFFLIYGITNSISPLPLMAFTLMTLRNITGDLRDISRDKKEKIKTLPIFLGFTKDWKNIHLVFLLITTLIWWYLAEISAIYLIIALILEITTYNITPR